MENLALIQLLIFNYEIFSVPDAINILVNSLSKTSNNQSLNFRRGSLQKAKKSKSYEVKTSIKERDDPRKNLFLEYSCTLSTSSKYFQTL